MYVPLPVLLDAADPHGLLDALVESTAEKLAGPPAGRHNAGRRAELAWALEDYRRQLAAADGRQPR